MSLVLKLHANNFIFADGCKKRLRLVALLLRLNKPIKNSNFEELR